MSGVIKVSSGGWIADDVYQAIKWMTNAAPRYDPELHDQAKRHVGEDFTWSTILNIKLTGEPIDDDGLKLIRRARRCK